jgi:flagellar hook-basal body complex protein FliE
MTGIDTSKIEAMVAQLKAAGARAQGAAAPVRDHEPAVAWADFAGALKASLEQVSAAQKKAEGLGQRFAAGDDSVNLSDAMIAMQKASITFQATVQVRNKLVAAYHDIMNMQV